MGGARADPHYFRFQIPPLRPMDQEAKARVLAIKAVETPFVNAIAQRVSGTAIGWVRCELFVERFLKID